LHVRRASGSKIRSQSTQGLSQSLAARRIKMANLWSTSCSPVISRWDYYAGLSSLALWATWGPRD